ncbi:MAG: sulfurtransferase TusA family protein [Deltaproteobacteria bacterium]|nr:sulfurtransferase TusA family protein [Deltaproteobacteria bacterium]
MQILDLRGFITPFTLLKVSNTFKEMSVGGTLEILWSNPETSSDLFKVLQSSSFEVIIMEEVEGKEPYYRAKLKKRHV